MWSQLTLKFNPRSKGCYLVTSEVLQQIGPTIAKCKVGLVHILLQHTSASLALNENADPDVRTDMKMMLDKLVPENMPYIHTYEGPDDMPAHIFFFKFINFI
ncbi:hypothetical protein BB561_003064 [Smittium simulii]|uniref:Secondary thiamine-phosphate synthase enzyme n=1 Tax=Smittium simulii TaxID=133385 RepID=A0A2T9YN47_9FUNG|nr:hypothetical protein BB561_003064 [Smittium simulii]